MPIEFAYAAGKAYALVDGWWRPYMSGAEVGDPVVRDDGTRGWLLADRLVYASTLG